MFVLTSDRMAMLLLSLNMDYILQRLASALGMFLVGSPQWPRSDALDRVKAIAQDLLNLVRTDLEPELASTNAAADRGDKHNAKTAVDVDVRPPTGKALARQRWPFRDAYVAQVCRKMVPGVCS